MKLIEIRRASLFDLFHFTKKMPSLPDRLSLKVDRKLRVVIVWVFESHPWYLNECLMFNLLYRQLAHTASMRMDTPPVLVGTFKDKRTACGHFVTVGNRPWFGYTCWPYKKRQNVQNLNFSVVDFCGRLGYLLKVVVWIVFMSKFWPSVGSEAQITM